MTSALNPSGGASAEKPDGDPVVQSLDKPNGHAAAAKKPACDSPVLTPRGRSLWRPNINIMIKNPYVLHNYDNSCIMIDYK